MTLVPPLPEEGCAVPWSDGQAVRLFGDAKWAGYENWGENDLPKSRGEYRLALQMFYVACKKAELSQAGYAVLDAMTDTLLSSSATRNGADMPIENSGMKLGSLYELRVSSLPGWEILKSERNHTLWNPILNYAGDKLDFRTHDSRLVCYNSTKELVMDFLEKK